ncbi:hypothetical protein [Limnohabitans sp. B9-3]|uniref:hypothetical protein n=1 Tax=Limnohabitans sp. B9-3 TaxID=1100707 RepID=UPI00117AB8D4|nr:hypothetical protein [Limnohabitans sp. B9-3]
MQTFTKIQVATISLIQAKEAFIRNDFVSATILSGAAQQIVRDICKSRGIEPTLKTISNVSGHSGQLVHDLVTDAYNKMKHADKDPEGVVEVSQDEPRALMTLAATDLMRLKEITSKEISEFVEFVRTIKSPTNLSSSGRVLDFV